MICPQCPNAYYYDGHPTKKHPTQECNN